MNILLVLMILTIILIKRKVFTLNMCLIFLYVYFLICLYGKFHYLLPWHVV